MSSKPTTTQLRAFLLADFPQNPATLEESGDGTARMRQKVDVSVHRPGGTVAGPVMMALADAAAYAAILSAIGIVPLAVTTSFNANFLRRPRGDRDLLADASLLKLGRRLAVAEITVYSEGEPDPVCHVTATYSIPPEGRAS